MPGRSLSWRASRLSAVGACVVLSAWLAGAPAAVARAPKRIAVSRAELAQRPWLGAELTPQQRAQMLLEQMTLPEKVDLMTGNQGEAPYAFYNAPIVRLGIPALKMSDSAPESSPWLVVCRTPRQSDRNAVRAGAWLDLVDGVPSRKEAGDRTRCARPARTSCSARSATSSAGRGGAGPTKAKAKIRP